MNLKILILLQNYPCGFLLLFSPLSEFNIFMVISFFYILDVLDIEKSD